MQKLPGSQERWRLRSLPSHWAAQEVRPAPLGWVSDFPTETHLRDLKMNNWNSWEFLKSFILVCIFHNVLYFFKYVRVVTKNCRP